MQSLVRQFRERNLPVSTINGSARSLCAPSTGTGDGISRPEHLGPTDTFGCCVRGERDRRGATPTCFGPRSIHPAKRFSGWQFSNLAVTGDESHGSLVDPQSVSGFGRLCPIGLGGLSLEAKEAYSDASDRCRESQVVHPPPSSNYTSHPRSYRPASLDAGFCSLGLSLCPIR